MLSAKSEFCLLHMGCTHFGARGKGCRQVGEKISVSGPVFADQVSRAVAAECVPLPKCVSRGIFAGVPLFRSHLLPFVSQSARLCHLEQKFLHVAFLEAVLFYCIARKICGFTNPVWNAFYIYQRAAPFFKFNFDAGGIFASGAITLDLSASLSFVPLFFSKITMRVANLITLNCRYEHWC